MRDNLTPVTNAAQSIFILGIMKRSGTNFLHDLLSLHPDCVTSAFIREDYLVQYADLLDKYATSVSGRWNPAWGIDGSEDRLCRSLGDGLISFLASQAAADENQNTKRLITKTPSVQNLKHFFRFLPDVQLLILVRDGRAVVESMVKSFGWSYEKAIQSWAEAAHTILHFAQTFDCSNPQYLIIKYEDLYGNPEAELVRIFTFLNLDVSAYDFETAANLSVKGSSELRQQGEKTLHWQPVEKTADFNPLLRWSHWDRALHERFNWVAGQYLVKFGYEKKLFPTNQLWWITWNKLTDTKWRLRKLLGGTRRKILPKAFRRK